MEELLLYRWNILSILVLWIHGPDNGGPPVLKHSGTETLK